MKIASAVKEETRRVFSLGELGLRCAFGLADRLLQIEWLYGPY